MKINIDWSCSDENIIRKINKETNLDSELDNIEDIPQFINSLKKLYKK